MREQHIKDVYTATRVGLFYPFDPKREAIPVEEIARSLAATARWRGHTDEPFSVAEHSIMVARKVSPENRLYALLHDAGEALLCDVPAPIKCFLRFELRTEGGGIEFPPFSCVEQEILNAVLESLGIPVGPMPQEVHAADMSQRKWEWDHLVRYEGEEERRFVPLSPRAAMVKWLEMYDRFSVDRGQLTVDSGEVVA
jgi:hypothetical protein